MKPLSVKKYRHYFVINATRVGMSHSHGNYATEAEARAAADELLAKHTLGLIAQPVKLQLVKDAAANFIVRQEERVTDGDISRSHFEDIERAVRFSLKIKIDGKRFGSHDLSIVRQEMPGICQLLLCALSRKRLRARQLLRNASRG